MPDMSAKKLKQSFIPAFAGLLIAFILLFIYQKITSSFYGPKDGDEVFSYDFFLITYSIAFIPCLVVAGIFQYLIGLPIWEKYKNGGTIFNLRLWQLVVLSCIVFSLLFFLFFYDSQTVAFANPALAISAAIIISLFYWAANIFTLNKLS